MSSGAIAANAPAPAANFNPSFQNMPGQNFAATISSCGIGGQGTAVASVQDGIKSMLDRLTATGRGTSKGQSQQGVPISIDSPPCGEPSPLGEIEKMSCSAFQVGGKFVTRSGDPSRPSTFERLLSQTATNIADVDCKQAKLTALGLEMDCLSNASKSMMQMVGNLKAAFDANLNRMRSQETLINGIITEKNTQLKTIGDKLGPLKAMAASAQVALQQLDTRIARFQTARTILAQKRTKYVKDLNTARVAAINSCVTNAFKVTSDSAGNSYTCRVNGGVVTLEDAMVCRYGQSLMQPGQQQDIGQYDADLGTTPVPVGAPADARQIGAATIAYRAQLDSFLANLQNNLLYGYDPSNPAANTRAGLSNELASIQNNFSGYGNVVNTLGSMVSTCFNSQSPTNVNSQLYQQMQDATTPIGKELSDLTNGRTSGDPSTPLSNDNWSGQNQMDEEATLVMRTYLGGQVNAPADSSGQASATVSLKDMWSALNNGQYFSAGNFVPQCPVPASGGNFVGTPDQELTCMQTVRAQYNQLLNADKSGSQNPVAVIPIGGNDPAAPNGYSSNPLSVSCAGLNDCVASLATTATAIDRSLNGPSGIMTVKQQVVDAANNSIQTFMTQAPTNAQGQTVGASLKDQLSYFNAQLTAQISKVSAAMQNLTGGQKFSLNDVQPAELPHDPPADPPKMALQIPGPMKSTKDFLGYIGSQLSPPLKDFSDDPFTDKSSIKTARDDLAKVANDVVKDSTDLGKKKSECAGEAGKELGKAREEFTKALQELTDAGNCSQYQFGNANLCPDDGGWGGLTLALNGWFTEGLGGPNDDKAIENSLITGANSTVCGKGPDFKSFGSCIFQDKNMTYVMADQDKWVKDNCDTVVASGPNVLSELDPNTLATCASLKVQHDRCSALNAQIVSQLIPDFRKCRSAMSGLQEKTTNLGRAQSTYDSYKAQDATK